jgi:hypothetical protein
MLKESGEGAVEVDSCLLQRHSVEVGEPAIPAIHCQLRIDIKQNVNVIGHDLALMAMRCLGNLSDNLFEPLINASNPDRASVFRGKKPRGTCTKKQRSGSIDHPSPIK